MRIHVKHDPVTTAGTSRFQTLDTSKFPALQPILANCVFMPFGRAELYGLQDAVAQPSEQITQLILNPTQENFMSLIKQILAPVHGGKAYDDGTTGFNPEQFIHAGTLQSLSEIS